jgi:hypothetical protein
MANTLIPADERTLTPAEVAAIDRRRRRGHLLVVMGFQFTLIATLVTLWAGQDLTYGPGWTHPMAYWDGLLWLAALVSFLNGLRLRRGVNEFFSY